MFNLRGNVNVKERRSSAQWAHRALLKQLPVSILATYINLLRYCKSVVSCLIASYFFVTYPFVRVSELEIKFCCWPLMSIPVEEFFLVMFSWVFK